MTTMQPNPNRLSAAMGRTSPFKRQTSSASPASSPSKHSNNNNNNVHSLSPEKASPFVRRPSQISNSSERPSSLFVRSLSGLSVPASPARKDSSAEEDVFISRRQSSVTPAPDEPGTPTIQLEKPTKSLDGARSSSEQPFLDSPIVAPGPATLRSTPQRTAIPSAAGAHTPQEPSSRPKVAPSKLTIMPANGGAYNHIPQSLLQSMREAFEVLDSSNSGAVTSASVSDMLSQLGLDSNPAALRTFFPPNGPGQLNLARYLDTLSGPLTELSQPEELRAAFEAFDVDDSGQIDVSVLRDALLHTAPNPGEDMIKLSETEVDGILGEFAGRRAFGSKGVNASKGKGDVFRYKDFMANVGPTATGGDRVAT